MWARLPRFAETKGLPPPGSPFRERGVNGGQTFGQEARWLYVWELGEEAGEWVTRYVSL